MSSEFVHSSDWINQLYREAGNEISLSYKVLNDTTQWTIAVTAALASGIVLSTVSLPSIISFLASLFAMLLLVRFFVRSCIAYVDFRRWAKLARAILYYWVSENTERSAAAYDFLSVCVDIYYFGWKSPITTRKVIWDNMKLVYLWPFLGLISLVIWTLCQAIGNPWSPIALIAFLVAIGFEVFWFWRYHAFKYQNVPNPPGFSAPFEFSKKSNG